MKSSDQVREIIYQFNPKNKISELAQQANNNTNGSYEHSVFISVHVFY